MKKINPEAIGARTGKYVGLCTDSGAREDLTSHCYTTRGSKEKTVITGTGLQEPLPFG